MSMKENQIKAEQELWALMKSPVAYEDQDASSEVANYYANKSVFITGATGFIGKAIAEKLIRSCLDIKKIYILVREKKGKPISDRYDELIKSQMFDRVRATLGDQHLRDKLVAIGGDITRPKFGISSEDMVTLSSECSIVINSAATVRFVEPLDVAVRNNVYSVGQLAELCNGLKNLKAIVHLSSAYSNCHKKDQISEVFYEPPMGGDELQLAVEKVKEMQDNIDRIMNHESSLDNKNQLQTFYQRHLTSTNDLLGQFTELALRQSNRPNTYTFTKAISENYLLERLRSRPDRYLGHANDKIQLAIVRPSIVSASWREPVVGFVDNFNGPTGVMLYLYTGAAQGWPGERNAVLDFIPVDMVANMTLCAAWFLGSGKHCHGGQKEPALKLGGGGGRGGHVNKDKGAFIFNLVSGSRNPLRLRDFSEAVAEMANKWPSKHLVRLPSSFFLKPGPLYELYDFVSNKLPAYAIDWIQCNLLCKTLNDKTSSVAAYKRIRSFGHMLEPFTANEWRMADRNTQALWTNHLNESDRRLFHFDVKAINWSQYLRQYTIGTRVYALRDPPTNIPEAVKMLNRRRWAQRIGLSLPVLAISMFQMGLIFNKTYEQHEHLEG